MLVLKAVKVDSKEVDGLLRENSSITAIHDNVVAGWEIRAILPTADPDEFTVIFQGNDPGQDGK